MCKYCEVDHYCGIGADIKPDELVSPKDESIEICLFDSPDDEHFVLLIDGSFTTIKMMINFCPICGRKIGSRAK